MNMENDFNKLMIDKGEIEERIIESGKREIVADSFRRKHGFNKGAVKQWG